MSAADEAQARAYRDRWRQRLAATVLRERALHGQPAAWRHQLDNWQPWLVPERAYPVGEDSNGEIRYTVVNG